MKTFWQYMHEESGSQTYVLDAGVVPVKVSGREGQFQVRLNDGIYPLNSKLSVQYGEQVVVLCTEDREPYTLKVFHPMPENGRNQFDNVWARNDIGDVGMLALSHGGGVAGLYGFMNVSNVWVEYQAKYDINKWKCELHLG